MQNIKYKIILNVSQFRVKFKSKILSQTKFCLIEDLFIKSKKGWLISITLSLFNAKVLFKIYSFKSK